MRQGSEGVGVEGMGGGLLPCFCIRCRSVTLPPSVASLVFFVFFREQFVLARKMSRYPVSSASIPPSPPRRLSLSLSLHLSLPLALLLRRLQIRSFLFLRSEWGKLDAASHGHVRITEEERERGERGRRLLSLHPSIPPSGISYQQSGPSGVVDAVS